jgi:hypothetical protein
MSESKSVPLVPPVSCVEAVRSLAKDDWDKILRRGLDRKAVATLAGAVAQLSGRGDMAGQYGEYLDAVLHWVEALQQDLLRLAQIQSFLALHQQRWIELERLHADPKLDLAHPVRFRSHIGNINRQERTASPTAPYTTPLMRLHSRKEIQKEQRIIHDEIVLVRDRFGAECVTRIGLHRWMLRMLFQEASLEEQSAARARVDALKAANASLAMGDLVNACRSSGSAEKLLDLLHLSLEHPSSWILDESGHPDQAFTRELDGNFEHLLNPFFEKVQDRQSRLMERASGAMKKGYQGATVMNKSWTVLKTMLGVGALYSAILALGSDAWNKSALIVKELTTPDEVLEYEAQFLREQGRKLAIADKTVVAVVDRDSRKGADKSFAEVISNYVRENAGDRVALLFSRYLKHCLETGRNDWLPDSEEDRRRMPLVTDLVALLNVQLFNEGPFTAADGKPQRFLSSGVVDRWPWRSETEANLEYAMQALKDQDRRTAFPLPTGLQPTAFRPPPQPTTKSKLEIALRKIWDRHLAKGFIALWRNRPIRWGAIFAVVIGGLWALRRQIRRREQYRLVPASGAGAAASR